MNKETLEEVSPMKDLLEDLKETKVSVKESIDIIKDELIRGTINLYVQTTLDNIITRIENELLEKESKQQAERMYSEAIEFAEWVRIKDFQTTSKDNWIGLDMKYYTTEELFEQFKKK